MKKPQPNKTHPQNLQIPNISLTVSPLQPKETNRTDYIHELHVLGMKM